MICDLLEVIPERADAADVCVIGAGAAGIALAVELRRAGKSVVLLEGGGAEIEAQAQEPYASEVAALAHRGIHHGRFRAKGGTTTRWGGQILELEEWDFARRAWVAGSGWPFAKAMLQPFYRRALELEGVACTIADDGEVWRELGVPEPRFETMQSYLSRWCPEPNFARLHGAALTQDDGLQLWLHANVTALEFEDEAVVGVRARTQGGREAIFRAREFVFCLGAIESSRFFLQPLDRTIPWNASGLLGRHFQDHIDCNVGQLRPRAGTRAGLRIAARARRKLDRCFDGIFLHGFKYQPKIRLTHAEQQRAETLNVAAALAYESDSDAALSELRATAKNLLRGRLGEVELKDAMRAVTHAPALWRQSWRYACEHRSYQPASAKISLRVHCEQEPCSASAITLSAERDSLGLYRTRLCWRISPLELKTIRHFAAVAARSLAPIAELQPMAEMDDDAALTAACEDSFHHMGGMRMHDSPTRGVVNTDLKLHGTKNAYVLSSAVFPTSGFSNPTHTLLALAVRLSERLSKE